jgi:hypothetical protein
LKKFTIYDYMTNPGFKALPASVRVVLVLLLVKAVLAFLEHIVPYVAPPMPLPFHTGLLTFALPSIIVPLILYAVFARVPATGYWGTALYVPLTLVMNALLVGTPYFVTRPLGIPDPDPFAIARILVTGGRVITSFVSLLLIAALLRRAVRQWVTQQEEMLLAQRFPSRRTPSLAERGAWILPVGLGLIVPTAVWMAVDITVAGTAPGDVMFDILLEHLKGRALLLDVWSLIPFLVLGGIAHHNAGTVPSVTLWSVTVGGVFGILALMIPAYWIAWDTIYNTIPGDEKTMGAMVFFFTPLYCLATMFAGMLLGWLFARIMRRGVDDLVEVL